jgi:hypothetical protein
MSARHLGLPRADGVATGTVEGNPEETLSTRSPSGDALGEKMPGKDPATRARSSRRPQPLNVGAAAPTVPQLPNQAEPGCEPSSRVRQTPKEPSTSANSSAASTTSSARTCSE